MATYDDLGVPTILRGSNKTGDYYVVRASGTVVAEYPHWLGKDTVESHINTYADTAGVEEIILADGARNVYGNRNLEKLTGNDADNILLGGQGKTLIEGGEGNDTLNGGVFSDTLVGGGGADTFQFGEDADCKASTILYEDVIEDFDPAVDRIVLNTATFKNLAPGFSFVVTDTKANLDKLSSQIIYCTENGGLYYNPNKEKANFTTYAKIGRNSSVGDEGGLFVTLSNKPLITKANIWIQLVDPSKVKPFQPTSQTNPVVQ